MVHRGRSAPANGGINDLSVPKAVFDTKDDAEMELRQVGLVLRSQRQRYLYLDPIVSLIFGTTLKSYCNMRGQWRFLLRSQRTASAGYVARLVSDTLVTKTFLRKGLPNANKVPLDVLDA